MFILVKNMEGGFIALNTKHIRYVAESLVTRRAQIFCKNSTVFCVKETVPEIFRQIEESKNKFKETK